MVGEKRSDGFEMALFVEYVNPLLPERPIVFEDREALLGGDVDLMGGGRRGGGWKEGGGRKGWM